MKPGSSSTGWPSPCGACISIGSEYGSEAISNTARTSSIELKVLGRPAWGCRVTMGAKSGGSNKQSKRFAIFEP